MMVSDERFEELLKLQKQIQKEMRQEGKKRIDKDCIGCMRSARQLNQSSE